MTEITRILLAIEKGDSNAAAQLFPLVYDELRRLAKAKLAHERPNHTLQATALVHEAWLRLIGSDQEKHQEASWNSSRHFLGAAAEAMRRILVESARARKANKRGGNWQRVAIDAIDHPVAKQPDKLLALDGALQKLEEDDSVKASLVKLRFFAGLTNAQAAETLGISTSTADRYWAYTRAWLQVQMSD